jgi:hypothetical protein
MSLAGFAASAYIVQHADYMNVQQRGSIRALILVGYELQLKQQCFSSYEKNEDRA